MEAEDLESGEAEHAPIRFPGAAPAHVRAFRLAAGVIAAAAVLATSVVMLVPRDTRPLPELVAVSPETSPLPEDADMARRVQGTFTVPCYMTDPDGPGGEPPCSPGSRLNLDANGVPEQNGTWTANFNCMIPYAALNDPARPTIYGHGLLGSASEGTSSPQKTSKPSPSAAIRSTRTRVRTGSANCRA